MKEVNVFKCCDQHVKVSYFASVKEAVRRPAALKALDLRRIYRWVSLFLKLYTYIRLISIKKMFEGILKKTVQLNNMHTTNARYIFWTITKIISIFHPVERFW